MSAKRLTTDEERELVLEIADGMPEIVFMIGHIRIIAQDAHHIGYMDILRWLKRQNLKGINLRVWISEKQHNSLLQAIAYARKQIYSDSKVRPIFAKNY